MTRESWMNEGGREGGWKQNYKWISITFCAIGINKIINEVIEIFS